MGLSERTIKDGLVVPDGAICSLRHAVVRGGITLGTDADFAAYNAEVRGIETDLSCSGNGSATNSGLPNTVGGATLGQCAGR